MNRQQKRAAAQRLRKNSATHLSFKQAQSVAEILDEVRKPSGISVGDKVVLDYEKITNTQQWSGANPAYREFIDVHKDEVFTAEAAPAVEGRVHKQIFQLAEDQSEPKWLFWGGHLKKVKGDMKNEADESV